jgi:hypothetical protein
MIEMYAIAAGALMLVGAVLGILVIWAVGVRYEKANHVAVANSGRITAAAHPARQAGSIARSRLPELIEAGERPAQARRRPAEVRRSRVGVGEPEPELTLTGRAMAGAGSGRSR